MHFTARKSLIFAKMYQVLPRFYKSAKMTKTAFLTEILKIHPFGVDFEDLSPLCLFLALSAEQRCIYA